eukprot:TRINITY_DN7633_c0_g2_i2.p1 TRINITY_DN7633_c0_g2~~TRINITY_DN7633_c0_g2_i2.p1  ORF type:complete len:254 (+),score=39.15 TRINITY_DN7633_c0_g2_i2:87-764(+)
MGGDYEIVDVLHQHQSSVHCLCELSNSWIISGSLDYTLKVCDVPTKKVIHSLAVHPNGVSFVIELKRNRGVDKHILIATSGLYVSTISIWDVTTGAHLRALNGHKSSVRRLVELADGTLLSSSTDGTFREWDIHTGGCLSVLETTQFISCMTPLRDGSIIIGEYQGAMEVRKTRFTRHLDLMLVDLCCQSIAKHSSQFVMASLELYLPKELFKTIMDELSKITTS